VVWSPIIWQNAWGKYLNEDITGNVFVDGGMLSNFPIHFFLDYLEPDVIKVMGKERSNNVIGLLLDEDKPVPGIAITETTTKATTGFAATFGNLPILSIMGGLSNTVLSSGDELTIQQNENSIFTIGCKRLWNLGDGNVKRKRRLHSTKQVENLHWIS